MSNPIVKNFVNNYLTDTDKITIEKLRSNFECCNEFLQNNKLTEIEKRHIVDLSKNLYRAMVLLYSIVNWNYLPTNDDGELKQVYEEEFNKCIDNSYRIAEELKY